MCGAPAQGVTGITAAEVGDATVIAGVVEKEGAPVPGAYVRLLDGSGEFTAEVVTSATGQFRFYAAPGTWTTRALAPGATAEYTGEVEQGLTELRLQLG
ncbi:MAG: DUF1416 domain-containing protein [Actinomycetota bacterium]|nr:DUF1416 domain-containing protein [Actinomycetota bacterium]